MLGAAALAREDKPGAVAAYLGVDKREASFFEARLRAAEILRDQGKLDEAERALNDAAGAVSQADTPAKAEDRRIDVAIALSQVDEKRGDAARAARRLDEALGKDGDTKGEAAADRWRAPRSTNGAATGSARSRAASGCSRANRAASRR